MRGLRDARRVAPLLAAAALAACAPAAKRPPVVAAEETAPHIAALEQRHRDKALALTRDERWSDAEIQWQILALLRPEVREYGERAEEARRRLKGESDARLQAAAEARRRGNAEQASLLYLKALNLDPGNAAALQALRQIERERAPRGNHARSGRVAAMPKPQREAAAAKAAPAPYPNERRDLDYGVMLYHQGEYAASIRALEAYLRNSPRDDLGRRYLAQACVQFGQQQLQQGRKEESLALFDKAAAADPRETESLRGTIAALRKSLADDAYQQGLRAYNTDIRLAIAHWERSLKYDPNHLQAGMRLRQARQAERNLQAIDRADPKK